MSLHPSIILFFLLLPHTEAKSNTSTNVTSQFCLPTTCGRNGPQIRFPFRLKTQPVFCGLQGFELSCSDNYTILHLPSSPGNGEFYVQEISYLDRRITIIDADETTCPVKTLLNLNLTSSKSDSIVPFDRVGEIAIVNCTENIAGSSQYLGEAGPIACMSDDKNFVFVTLADTPFYYLPSTCSMSQTTGLPLPLTTDLNHTVTKFLETRRVVMAWEALEGCYDCEKSRNFCGFNFTTTNSTICIENKNFCGFDFTTNSTICIKNKDPVRISVIIGTSIGGLIFFTLVALIIYKTIKSGKEREIQQEVEKFLKDYKTLNPTRYTYSDLKKITGKFKHKLGQGGYGSVYKENFPMEFLLLSRFWNIQKAMEKILSMKWLL